MTPHEYNQIIGAPRYTLGLDLGQSQDYSALCALEVHGAGEQAEYRCLYLKRWELMTSYPSIVADLAMMLRRAPLSTNRPRLAVDTTGVGRPVWDMLKRAGLNAILRAITITAGNVVVPTPIGFNTPKRDLIGAAQLALQNGKLKIAAALPDAEILTTELKNYRIKISASGHDTYGNSTAALDWRDPNAAHDDLVLALACALWLDQRPGFSVGRTSGVI